MFDRGIKFLKVPVSADNEGVLAMAMGMLPRVQFRSQSVVGGQLVGRSVTEGGTG